MNVMLFVLGKENTASIENKSFDTVKETVCLWPTYFVIILLREIMPKI